MNRFKIVFILMASLTLVACGGDDDAGSKKDKVVECVSNADCDANEICDQASGQCVSFGNNSGNNANSQNSTNSTNNTNNINNTNNTATNNTNNTNNVSPMCGDGTVDVGEICDGNCPVMCDDRDACTIDSSTGSADTCDLLCSFSAVTSCSNDDGCCPMGCDGLTDNDCLAELCGNSAVDGGETCDSAIPAGNAGACPTVAECVPQEVCSAPMIVGDASTCDAACVFSDITACVNDDGCCPSSCDDSLDNDCAFAVGAACTANDECESGFCATEDATNWQDGYCSSACQVDSDCPGPGTRCTGRICVDECVNSNECRTGYECYDLYGNGFNICAPAQTAALPGEACTTEDDCLGGVFGVFCGEVDSGFAGGYCFTGCQVDGDCPATTHCTPTDNGAVCVPDCVPGQNQCRTGYECFDYLDDPRNTCGPVASGTAVVGDACTVLQDCAGGQDGFCLLDDDFNQGFCSESCNVDAECPTNTHCGFDDNRVGVCLPNCTTDADCPRSGYACVDGDDDMVTECFPSGVGAGVIGDTCLGVFECGGGADAACLSEDGVGWREGYCSESCVANVDCPMGSHCGLINADGDGLCIKDCLNSADCRSDGYQCFDIDDDMTTECAPAATGTGLPGAVCAGAWECAGGPIGFCIGDTQGWPEGYCSTSGCLTNFDCAQGSHCSFQDPQTNEGICLDSCSTDVDCRTDYGCYDIEGNNSNECLPIGTNAVGAACDGFWQCGGRENAVCAAEPNFPDGYCLLDCSPTGTTCPSGTECIDFGNGSEFCMDSCATVNDCRTGYLCGQGAAGSGNVCLP